MREPIAEPGHRVAPVLVGHTPLVGRFTELAACYGALTDEDVSMVLITGSPGVGKTRLMTELCDKLARERDVLRCVTSPGIVSAPLAALAHLLPEDALAPELAGDPARAFHRVVLAYRARPRRPVLSVDDLHQLDSTSLALIHQLLTLGLIQVVATLRSGVELSEAARAMRRVPVSTEVELRQLTEDHVDTLLHLRFGMPVDAALGQQLWRRSQGNPLLLIELVRRLVADGAVAESGGVLLLTKPLPADDQADALFLDRVARCSPAATDALDLLACAGPLGLEMLEAMAGTAAVEELERLSLVTLQVTQRRCQVAPEHPILADALAVRLTALRRRRLLRTLIDRVEQYGARRRDDPLRVAAWRLDAGLPVEPDALLTAARLARHAHDAQAVERYARLAQLAEVAVAPASAVAIEAATLLGEALVELARFAEAEEVLATIPAGDEEGAASIAVIRAANLAEGLLRPADGLAVIRAAYATAPSPFLRAAQAWHLMVDGRPAEALVMLGDDRRLIAAPDARTVVARAQVAAPCLAMAGRTQDALASCLEADAALASMDDLAALNHRGLHRVNEALALCEAGRLAEAEAVAADVHAQVASGAAIAARVWAAITLGRVLLVSGRLTAARRWYLEASSLAAARGLPGPARAALVGLVTACAQLGDGAAAQARLIELRGLPGPFGFMGPEEALAPGWAAAVSGGYSEGAAILVRGAETGAASGHVTTAAWLLHDAVRMSPATARRAADPITELAGRSDSDLLAARAEHVRAVADGRPESLLLAARTLEQAGLLVVAAEALCAAATRFERDGERRRSRSTMVQARQLIGRLDGARTPGLAPAATAAELTEREREIAVLAGAGFSSKDIAARLYLSARTVDNHLQRVYDKLGVNGRQALAAALEQA